jgi:hypothetical protein
VSTFVGQVWLLWGERPTSEGVYGGDSGILVGIYADRPSARAAAAAHRRHNRRGSLLITKERVLAE